MGVVVIEGKSHPVFQGLNIIGRSEAATVTIRKVEVSKQHAFIVVVKESEHYLSDFKSSNGTFLNESQLNPLMLYDIPSDAEIKFGNVSAKYLKYPQEQSHNQLECHSPRNTENYFDDDFSFDDITTQMISKESENTVLKNPDSIHDMPTQMLYQKNSSHCSISIHEAETQKVDICILKEDAKSPSINDMPTQLLNDTEKDDTTIIDETILTDEVSEMNTTNTSQYSDTELKLQVTQLKHRKLKPISDSEEISNTDSSDQIITFKKKKIQVIQSDPETDIEDDEILSDSAADIEDSISINNEVQIPSKKVVAMLSSNVACLDSDSDIDDFECNTQANLQSEVNDESQDIIPSTQFSEECDNQTSTLTSTQNEELLALAVENGINPDGEYNNNINSVNIRKSLHLEETKSIRIDAMKPTQILPETDLIETKESVHKENVETGIFGNTICYRNNTKK
ncbi:hypothetical protein FQA39_LY09501 [Lamprigera yunnana]|nr:hypothetical protein FQA39_LY09501 [Lamprigera yunnana]